MYADEKKSHKKGNKKSEAYEPLIFNIITNADPFCGELRESFHYS